MKAEPRRTTISLSLGVQTAAVFGGSVVRTKNASQKCISGRLEELWAFYPKVAMGEIKCERAVVSTTGFSAKSLISPPPQGIIHYLLPATLAPAELADLP